MATAGSTNGANGQPNAESIDNSDGVPLPPPPTVPYDPASLFYDMTGKKLMYIFNQFQFQKSYFCPQQMKPRHGTEHDVAKLLQTFGRDGRFEIDEPCDDYTHSKIVDKINNIAAMDHSYTSCVAIVILTHGEENGTLWAADQPYSINNVINPILTAPSLAGKPKLFIVQACRGESLDPGLRIETDGSRRAAVVVPTHSDCLVLRSCYEDHYSFRLRSEGTWMIQSLCDVVDKHYNDLHILDMMTHVNASVANRITDCVDYPLLHEKKQISEVRFTLTKFLKFQYI